MLFTYAILDTCGKLFFKSETVEDDDLLELFQSKVEGFIQDLYIADKSLGILCNDEGLYTCKENRFAPQFLRHLDSNCIYQTLYGNILFCGMRQGEEISLTSGQIQWLKSTAQQLEWTVEE